MAKWVIKNKKCNFAEIAKRFGLSLLTSRLLCNRGLIEESEISAYLYPHPSSLHSPFLFRDMKQACGLICHAIKYQKKIRIVGDYDVDGIIATYVLLDALTRFGGMCDYLIPERIKDGYGMNNEMITQAAADGISLLITCDNGIRAVEQVTLAASLGIEVIITDHHDVIDEVPKAGAVINPKVPDCGYSFQKLCGAAVAFKLVQALESEISSGYKENETQNETWRYLGLVAMATICDVMELVDENRLITKLGLAELQKEMNTGLRMLVKSNGICEENISFYHMGYVIGPCINASGRLETAKMGLSLLLEDDEVRAEQIAKELIELNKKRKELTSSAVIDAIRIIESSDMKNDLILVVLMEHCHESIAGIVAGRIRETYHRPTIILTKTDEGVKGSARSVEQCNITAELTKCAELLDKFGGHPMAAGMSLREENVECLRRKLNGSTDLTEALLEPKISVDAVLPLGMVTEEVIEEMKLLEPFGNGNPKPVLAERNLVLRRCSLCGKSSQFVKLRVVNEEGTERDVLYFGNLTAWDNDIVKKYGQDELLALYAGRPNRIRLSITYDASINEYMGNRTVQFILREYLFAD